MINKHESEKHIKTTTYTISLDEFKEKLGIEGKLYSTSYDELCTGYIFVVCKEDIGK